MSTSNYSIQKKANNKAYLRAQETAQELLDGIYASQKKQDVLVLCGYGTQLMVRSVMGVKCLVYKQRGQEDQIFMPRVHRLRKIVWIYCTSRPSIVAVQWMQKEKISFVCIDRLGDDLTEKERRNDDTILQKMQFMLSDEQEREYATEVLKQKVIAQAATLKKYRRVLNKNAVAEADSLLSNEIMGWFTIKNGPWTITKKRLLDAEQKCAVRYFNAWAGMRVSWVKEDDVHAVYKSFATRSNGYESSNQHATHPVNAMLNYMNIAVAHRIKLTCLERGLHLKMSFLHLRQDNRQQKGEVKPDKRDGLIWDLIEPLRPLIEAALLKFLGQTELHKEWFVFSENGEVHCTTLLTPVLTLLEETELKDSQVESVVDAYIDWLRKTSGEQAA